MKKALRIDSLPTRCHPEYERIYVSCVMSNSKVSDALLPALVDASFISRIANSVKV